MHTIPELLSYEIGHYFIYRIEPSVWIEYITLGTLFIVLLDSELKTKTIPSLSYF